MDHGRADDISRRWARAHESRWAIEGLERSHDAAQRAQAAMRRALTDAVPDSEAVAVLHTLDGPLPVGVIASEAPESEASAGDALYVVTVTAPDPDRLPCARVQRFTIVPERWRVELEVRYDGAPDGVVWRDARWAFHAPGLELRFRTEQAIGASVGEVPDDFARALAARVGYELPEDGPLDPTGRF